MTKRFTAHEIEKAARTMVRATGIPIEVARSLTKQRAAELEAEESMMDAYPLLLKEIRPAAPNVPQYWSPHTTELN